MRTLDQHAWNALTISRLIGAIAFIVIGIVMIANSQLLLGSIVALIAIGFAVYEARRIRRASR